ncbi:class I SAM-dependent methyltransferase [Aquimarina sp. MMG016]|uniref:class I SAM-dependent methyltransferase n=1 Tax=Aquimarina sp. MMG016 TaxID=2822690 RepID=UPI001B3A208C|nr:class I SAM-dependent methyltransferase [Aquimarina sp. MMG016]MBQ4820226.1 class I SAM-dependent methyltransferase [Aquimarina sp. MMG016]
MKCSLCDSETKSFSEVHNRIYHRCITCKGISLHSSFFLSPEDEKERYLLHNNDISDKGYQDFVAPIIQTVLCNHKPNHNGLDFGSGSGPVITSLLRKKGYNITTYDPFFAPSHNTLTKKYNYIICCEVMEHFYNPAKEFKLLHSLLNPDGVLYCKTKLFNESIDFNSWWYKNDPTHVFFYTTETLQWIATNYDFQKIEIKKDVIIFSK